MIPHNDPETPPEQMCPTCGQPVRPVHAPRSTPPTRCVCPHCGHLHGPYTQTASDLLDLLTLAQEALRDAKTVVEEEVLP
jgi:hypothetical protein